MGDEEFGETIVEGVATNDLSAEDMVVDQVSGNERDSEVLRSEVKLPRYDRASE